MSGVAILGEGSLAAALGRVGMASRWEERMGSGSHLALGQAGNAGFSERRFPGGSHKWREQLTCLRVEDSVAPELAGIGLQGLLGEWGWQP